MQKKARTKLRYTNGNNQWTDRSVIQKCQICPIFHKREAPDPSIEIEIKQGGFAYSMQNYGEIHGDGTKSEYEGRNDRWNNQGIED